MEFLGFQMIQKNKLPAQDFIILPFQNSKFNQYLPNVMKIIGIIWKRAT